MHKNIIIFKLTNDVNKISIVKLKHKLFDQFGCINLLDDLFNVCYDFMIKPH